MRQVYLALVLATLFVGSVSAQTYDLLIKGGTVNDPSQGLNAARDVGIKNGLVTAVEANIDPGLAGQIYDATGKTVVPGLINIHSHFTSTAFPQGTVGVNVDAIAAARGYTTMVSAGDAGWPKAVSFHNSTTGWTTRTYAFLNIAWRGMGDGWEYTTNPPILAPTAVCPSGAITRADIEVCETAGALAANWQFYVGIKVRMSHFLIGNNVAQVLQMALDAAAKAEAYTGHHFPIMVHVGALYSTSSIDTIVSMLRSGDIVTHSYSEWVNQNGIPTGFAQNASCSNHSAAVAVAKGVVIDLGGSSAPTYGNNAFGPLSYIMCGKVDVYPPSLSADEFGTASGLYSMVDFASILLGLNTGNNISPTPPAAFLGPIQTAQTLNDMIYKMTRGPALALGDRAPALLGTLQIGAPGDVAVLNVQSGSFSYPIAPWTVTSPTKIEVVKTIKGGVIL